MKRANILTLGCAKNRVDSEHLGRAMEVAGWCVCFDQDDITSGFDCVVINSCGFILDAKQESVEAILMAVEAKSGGFINELLVMGCLSQRYSDELRVEIPEVDAFFGARDIDGILAHLSLSEVKSERALSTPQHVAYLKISEGCNWGCGYCAIPSIRGSHRSVPMEELVQEARWLADRGVRELVVIAQDSTYYGMDLYGERRLGALLQGLCRVGGIEWIRLQYAYPAQFPMDVLEVMAREPKICKYLDIPFQHISDNVLGTMRRGIDGGGTRQLLEEIRSRVPGIAVRTTMIVGYPTETEGDFEELKAFVRDARFERLGVFPYSEEEGTYSAQNFEDCVPQEVKEARVAEIMELQESIGGEVSQSLVDTTQRVLFDRIEGDYLIGRTQWDSPEVDGEVLVNTEDIKNPADIIGTFQSVAIFDAMGYDLYGTLLQESSHSPPKKTKS